MSDDFDGVDEVVVACVAIDPLQYSALRYALWRRSVEGMQEDGHEVPSVYPGSLEATCAKCGITVAVGPHQQAVLLQSADANKAAMITCLLCAGMLMADSNVTAVVRRAEGWEGEL